MEKKKRTFRGDVKRFFEPALCYKKYFFMNLAQVLIWPFYGIVTTLVLAKAVGYLQSGDKDMFFRVIVGFVIFIIVYQIYNGLMYNSGQRYSWKSYEHFFKKYFSQYITLDNNTIEMKGTGKMLSIMDKGIDQLVSLSATTIWYGTSAIVQIVFVTYLLSHVKRYAPFLLYIFLIVTLLIVMQLTKKGNQWRWKRDDVSDERSRHTVKILMSKFEILLNNKIDVENEKFSELIKQASYYDGRKMVYEHWGFNVPTIMISIITISLFLFLGYKFFYQNDITYAEIVLYLGLVNSLEVGTRDVISVYKQYSKDFQRVERLRQTFDTIPSMQGYDTGKTFSFVQGNISLHNISFAYNEGEVLKNFSLDILGGKKTALVGISGSGKTTILKLIAGYLHVTKGTVSVDDQQLPTKTNLKKSITLKSYYKHIGYLTQDPSVFDGTIYENFVYSLDYEPSKEQLDNAIQQAQCQFIYEFKDGLYTEIGEKGIRLSGGQRQRLAIAKIFLKNPEIILLDEPTSALDSLSEEAITKAMHNLFEGRTVIIIAHRLQTVKHADDIIVIEDGKVLERGTHKELVNMGGHYAKMLELQSGF